MTEDDWLACGDPELMLGHLEGRVTDRQLREFGVACVRRVGHLLRYERGRSAVEVAGRFAEGKARDAELAMAFASMTKIPVGEGFINVSSPGWLTPDPSESLPEYRDAPGDHGMMAAAQAVCASDARHGAVYGSRYAADAVAEAARHTAEVDWGNFREAHRKAKAIEQEVRSLERREQASLLRQITGGYAPRGTSQDP